MLPEFCDIKACMEYTREMRPNGRQQKSVVRMASTRCVSGTFACGMQLLGWLNGGGGGVFCEGIDCCFKKVLPLLLFYYAVVCGICQ